MGLECRGKEYVYGLEIHENHSYRMESLALLSGLTYFHQELKWKGTLQWYTDAKSVKDTYEGVKEYTFSKWNKQRDKDVWEAIIQLKPIWKDRINLIHVESHMDTKLKKRNIKRELTQPELLNIMADKIADAAYTTDMPWLNKKAMALARSTTISISDNMITGNWRTEIKEQIRIEKTKHRAQRHPYYWGVNTEEIEWKYMRKNWRKRTLKEKLQNVKLVNVNSLTTQNVGCVQGGWKQIDM
jgi:hypothetical protein